MSFNTFLFKWSLKNFVILIHIAVDNFCFNLKYFDTDVFSSDRERIISLVSYATTQSKFLWFVLDQVWPIRVRWLRSSGSTTNSAATVTSLNKFSFTSGSGSNPVKSLQTCISKLEFISLRIKVLSLVVTIAVKFNSVMIQLKYFSFQASEWI